MTLHRLADAVPQGTVRAFTAGATEVVVANVGGRLCALQRKCPHMGEDLGRGTLCGTALVCPRYAAAFVSTGKAVNPAKLLLPEVPAQGRPDVSGPGGGWRAAGRGVAEAGWGCATSKRERLR